MEEKAELDQEVLNDAELLALLCETQKEIEEHGESNQLNLLLCDFARELLKYRLLGIVALVRHIGLRPAKVESEAAGELKKQRHQIAVPDVADGKDLPEINRLKPASYGTVRGDTRLNAGSADGTRNTRSGWKKSKPDT